MFAQPPDARASQAPRAWQGKHADLQETEASEYSCDTHAYCVDAVLSPQSLCCEERLLSPCCEDMAASPARRLPPPLPHAADNGHDGILELIRTESERQATSRPSSSYLSKHPIDKSMRSMAVTWLADVVNACNLRRATLFLAVSYFDRFLSQAKDVPPRMLQLVATASISVAAKQEEVVQPTAAEWTAIADNAFPVEDLARAEWLLIHQLDWRLRTPTACVFLHLFACNLAQTTSKAFQVANYMLELSVLDYEMLQFDYSTVAAGGLVAAFQLLGMELDVSDLITLAPSMHQAEVRACADALLHQHLGAVAR